MKTTNQVTDQSRRKLLKKAYVTPVVIALGTMTFSSEVNAMTPRQHPGGNHGGGHHGGGHHHGGGSSSSLSGGSGWCGVCKHKFPCSHHP